MRILFLGDVVGRSGRDAVTSRLPRLRRELALDFVVVNAENAAGGFGLTAKIADELFDAGADVLTTGNHVWDQKEIIAHIDREPRILRPANFPASVPGRGTGLYDAAGGRRVLVVNVMGRLFMDPLDAPFQAVDTALAPLILGEDVDAIVVDVHAEATSEKMALAHYLDGRASLVVGTHTHVPTADAQILDGGTAYQSDAGMCGDYNSVIGMSPEEPIHRFVHKMNRGRMETATGQGAMCGVFVETDDATGRARDIQPVRLGARLRNVCPPRVGAETASAGG